MGRPKDTAEMTPRHWEILERIQRQLLARRYNGQDYPQATAPYHRPETQRVAA